MRLKTILITSFIALSFSCKAQQSTDYNDNNTINSTEISKVVIPTLPRSLSFADEPVPIENYDTRESLEQDIMVSMYMHSRTMTTLRSAKRYFNIIEPILKESGIPMDFKYLAVAESNLNPEAYSPAKAAGLWQILPTTATEAGLEVNATVDERYDVEKSTRVAIKYLKTAYNKFGNWTMAAASYNAGMAGVSRRAASQGVNNYYDLFLPRETMRYVFRILSFKLICGYPDSYGFIIGENDYYKPYEYKTIKVNSANIVWSDIAKQNGTTYKILREMNPWIRDYQHANKTGKTYEVKIPEEGFRTSK